MIVSCLHIRNKTDAAKQSPETGKTDTNQRNKPEFARRHDRATLGFPMKIIKQNETSIPPLRIWALNSQKPDKKGGFVVI
jgi:hypothetical protein